MILTGSGNVSLSCNSKLKIFPRSTLREQNSKRYPKGQAPIHYRQSGLFNPCGQPMQSSESGNTSPLPHFSATPSNSPASNAIPQCGIELIKEFEGYRENAYADPIEGWAVPTIGYGTTVYPDGRQVQQGDTITPEQADQYLRSHIATECTSALEKIPNWGKMNANQRGALYSFAYNVGAAFYEAPNRQSITAVCDSPDQWHNHDWVAEQFVKYRDPGSPAEEGLRRRRLQEAQLFCT